MSNTKPEDKLDWWNDAKQERSKPKSQPQRRSTPAKKRSTPTKSVQKPQRPLWLRLAINCAIIVAAIVALSVMAHYVLLTITRHNAHTTVPRFESMHVDQARELAAERGLELVVNDSVYVQIVEGGVVLEQNPLPDVEVKPGRAIYVTINALQREMVGVPYVAGRSLRQAKNMLEIAGLKIARLVYEPDLATNYVLSQSYNSTTIEEGEALRIPRYSGIVLHVGRNSNAEGVVVPQLIGMSLHEAQSALQVSGLNVGRITREGDVTPQNEQHAVVYAQSTEAERELELGDDVSFWLTLDKDRATQILTSIDDARKLEERMMAEEEALLDSINRVAAEMGMEGDTDDKKEPKNMDDSGFEDLF